MNHQEKHRKHPSIPQKVILSKISIKVKFSCRLNLEYRFQNSLIKSRQIKINPKENQYMLEQLIRKDQDSNENMVNILVKLVSNKGVSFTAGIIPINFYQLPKNSQKYKIYLNKALDPDSYCQLRCFTPRSNQNFKNDLQYSSISSPNIPQQFDEQLQLMKQKSISYSIADSQSSFYSPKSPQHKRYQTNPFSEQSSIDNLHKLELTQAELHRSKLQIRKQQEVISMLQSEKKQLTQQITQLKIQLRTTQNQLDQKRHKIRQLDSQKLNLIMNSVVVEKEISFSKQRSQQALNRVYLNCKKLLKPQQKNSLMRARKQSLQQVSLAKQADQSYKLPNPSDKFTFKEDLAWQQQSEVLKEDVSCNINDFSISNIQKHKQEFSQLNNQSVLKVNHTFSKPSLSQALKSISDQVKKYCQKIYKMVSEYQFKIFKETKELKENYQILCKQNNQFQANQESLVNHLQELQNALESRIAAVAMKDQDLNKAKQHIDHLEAILQQKDKAMAQLELQISTLQDEKKSIETQLHQANYQHAQKQEKLIASLAIQKPISPVKNHNISPKIISRLKRNSLNDMQDLEHQNQILNLKEQIRALELELSHKQNQHEELQSTLRRTQTQLSKCQFTIHLKNRMTSLNQSIELSEHSDHEEGTLQTSAQENFKKLLSD